MSKSIDYLPPTTALNRLKNAVAEIPHLVQPERMLFDVEKALLVIHAAERLWQDQNNVHAWEALYQGLNALERNS